MRPLNRASAACRRNAEHNELQALPDLASCRPGGTETLLYVCAKPSGCALLVWSDGSGPV